LGVVGAWLRAIGIGDPFCQTTELEIEGFLLCRECRRTDDAADVTFGEPGQPLPGLANLQRQGLSFALGTLRTEASRDELRYRACLLVREAKLRQARHYLALDGLLTNSLSFTAGRVASIVDVILLALRGDRALAVAAPKQPTEGVVVASDLFPRLSRLHFLNRPEQGNGDERLVFSGVGLAGRFDLEHAAIERI